MEKAIVSRNIDLDALKGIAIIAVVLYHIGILPFGYLGVDIFLVVNGYFITHAMLHQFNEKTFSYTAYLKKKLVRLWPLVVLASIISVIIGYYFMLPDDYENLGQSVVASNVFANNILACITTGNYWDVVNSHKPLMHTWYVGILVQCYVIFPIFVLCITKFSKNIGRTLLIILTLAFMALYILPFFNAAMKFYYLPFRLFEFLIGANIAANINDIRNIRHTKSIYVVTLLLIVSLCVLDISFINNQYKVLLISILTGGGILCLLQTKGSIFKANILYKLLATIGVMSYSIFIWHQVAVAFYKYSYNPYMNTFDYIILLIIICIVSVASYYLIEKPLSKIKGKQVNKLLIYTFTFALIISISGLFIYTRAGVVRDVPELGISTDKIQKGMHAAYCDRIYAYDKPFENNGKVKVLGIGDSFVRDFINVLLESKYTDSLDISYIYTNRMNEGNSKEHANRVNSADYVFMNREIETMPLLVKNALKSHENVWGIGTKSFGESNGFAYARRNSQDYFGIRVPLIPKIAEAYQSEKTYWKDRYVDFIAPIIDEHSFMPVFTDDSMYISQDCRHLTKEGARYYSKIIDLDSIFKKDRGD